MALLRSLSLDEKGGPSLVLPEMQQQDGQQDGQAPGDEEALAEGGRPGRAIGPKEAVLAPAQPAVEDASGPYLPDECVKLIQTHLIAGEPLGVALLHLLNMASVCRQWRALASELGRGSSIAFDCFENAFPTQLGVQRFRKLTSTAKEVVFTGAAKLLTGYSDVTLSGDGVSDRVLTELAAKNGALLTRAKVQASANVTDAGLCALVSAAKDLQELEVSGLDKPCAGQFLPLLFENCEQLTSLHLSGIPQLNWRPCKLAAAATWGPKSLTKLTVRGVNLETDFGAVLARLPDLKELEIDGAAKNLKDAVATCRQLVRVSYTVSSRAALDEASSAFASLPQLRHLELIVRNFTLCTDQLRLLGMLPLVELRLDSLVHKQQPTLSRSSYSHVDNEGVKALVDSICHRWASMGPAGEMQPLKLSLCGASALTHDAVSALLRLPILTELDIGGCARIIAMDKMRLVAKVRAGRELLDSGRRPSARASRFPGLLL